MVAEEGGDTHAKRSHQFQSSFQEEVIGSAELFQDHEKSLASLHRSKDRRKLPLQSTTQRKRCRSSF